MINKTIGHTLLDVSLLMMNVILYIPRLFMSILTREDSVKYTLPLFFSIIAFSFYPTYQYDLFRIYNNYHSYISTNEYQYTRDFLLYSLFFIGSKLGLKANFLVFFSCYLIYFASLKVLFDYKDIKHIKTLDYFLLFIIFILSIPIIQYTGIRFSSALAFLLLSLNYYFLEQKKKSIFFLFLSIFSHIALIIIIPILFVSQKIRVMNFSRSTQIIFIMIMFFIGLFPSIITENAIFLIDKINNLMGWSFISVSTYISGEWGVGRLTELNSTGQLVANFKTYSLCLLLFLFCFIVPRKLQLFNSYIFLVGFVFLFQQYATFFDRYSQVCVIYIIVMTLYIPKTRIYYCYILSLTFFLFCIRSIEVKDSIDFLFTSYSSIYKHSLINVILEVFS
ncbi:EpsG family protein [Photobacterium sp. GB-36]|uniref:EpsG family protein n=1 Tax=Photobacterium sp. GB-36 TaxID=2022108 RepID=UPI000D152FF6|nr:hypothetical protein C9J46_20940 [Photobacterium sp. GB-36]